MAVDRKLRNLIKTGQLWKKRDTGIIVEILGKSKEPYYNTRRVNKNKKNGAHHISIYDLLKHYEKVS